MELALLTKHLNCELRLDLVSKATLVCLRSFGQIEKFVNYQLS